MTEIKITVSVPGLPEAINNLADALRGNGVPVALGSAPMTDAKATQTEATDKVTPDVNPTTATVATAETATPAVDVTQAASSAPAPSEATTNYTIEQLSVAGAALCEQGKMAQLIALLGKYGVQAVTQLKPTPDVLNPFAAEMKALGANL